MENNAVNTLTQSHHDSLYGHALRLTRDIDDAKELVQDTMLRALRFYNNFQEGTNLHGWLYVIMKNTFINGYRRRSATQNLIVQTDSKEIQELYKGSIENTITGKFINADIQKALKSIPEDYANAFKRYFEGYKYCEIAKEFDLPIGTVKTRIHKARGLLKKYLKQYEN